MKNPVTVPTARGIGNSFKDFGIGAVAGILFLLAYQVFGALGILAAPLLAGSMIKGERGTVVATLAGFMLIAAGGIGATGGNSGASSDDEVM